MVGFAFQAEVIHWRGPPPYFFAPVPQVHREEIRRLTRLVSYGWGMIPVSAVVAGVEFSTTLFPKNDSYLLPLRAKVRKEGAITAGDLIAIEMSIEVPQR